MVAEFFGDPEAIEEASKESTIVDKCDVFVGTEEYTRKDLDRNIGIRFWYMLQQFMKGARMKSAKNDVMERMYFHSLVGAYLKEYTVMKTFGPADLRVPLIWIQPSGSGKSQLNKYMMDVANRIGLRIVQESQFTTAGMIGTFDRAIHDYNIKNNLHPGDKFESTDKMGNKKTKAYKPPVVFGELYYCDMIVVDEGKVLFGKSKDTENILSVLQPAMDTPGKVRKKLAADEPVEYECSCTPITTTVEFQNMNYDILSQGFFQRCLFLVKDMGITEYRQIYRESATTLFNEEEYNKIQNNIADAITHPAAPLSRERKKITVQIECLQRIADATDDWYRILGEKLYGQELRLGMSFVSRFNVFIFKIAGQVAVLNNKINVYNKKELEFIIGPDEVEYALELLEPLFRNLITGVTLEEDTTDKDMYKFIMWFMKQLAEKKVESVPRSDLINAIMVHKYMGRSRAQKYFAVLKSANFIREEKKGTALLVYPNWKLWKDKNSVESIKGGYQNETNVDM